MRQRGQALILAILALLVLTLLGMTLTGMGIVSMSASTNDREANEALYVADSGVAHAVGILAAQTGSDFDDLLQAGDGRGCSGDELAAPPAAAAVLAVSELIPADGRRFGAGGYRVSLCDDDGVERALRPPALPDTNPEHDANGSVLVRSTGLGRNGASATVEASVQRAPLPGLLVDGPLRVAGALALHGSDGSLHANGKVELLGWPCAERFFSAAGTILGAGLGGAACAGADADVRPQQPRLPVPALDIPGLRRYADHVLGADGLVRQGGKVVALPGWSWDGGRQLWLGDATIPPGVYYAEGNVELSNNPAPPPGEDRPALVLSVVAQGFIDAKGVSLTAALPGYALVAGTDLRLAGDPGTTYGGLFYAGDQLGFEGSPSVVGQLIVKNSGDTGAHSGLVRLEDGFVTLRGDSRVLCPGGGLHTVLVTGWRECRGVDPDDPCGPP